MQARALICDSNQKFTISDVTLPEPAAGQVAIRCLQSGVSIGTELALAKNKISWGPYPLCLGYQAVGIVEQLGESVSDLAVGDKVYYRSNESLILADGTDVSLVSGAHCSHAVSTVDGDYPAVRLPAGIADDAAAMFVMPAVGLYGVDMAGPKMGDVVVVNGAGMIGLGVVSAASLRGCFVIAIDIDDARLKVAGKLGADVLINAASQNVLEEVQKIALDGADVVLECSGIPACINSSVELCRQYGKFVWQGNYGESPVELSFLPAHNRRLTMFFPCDDGLVPCRRAVLKNMASGALPWQEVITHHIPCAEAPGFYTEINTGKTDGIIGATLQWHDA